MAPLRYTAKFDPFLSLDCAPTPSTLAQSKERKGSNLTIWQTWLYTLTHSSHCRPQCNASLASRKLTRPAFASIKRTRPLGSSLPKGRTVGSSTLTLSLLGTAATWRRGFVNCSENSTVVLQLSCCTGRQAMETLRKLLKKPLNQVTARPSTTLYV